MDGTVPAPVGAGAFKFPLNRILKYLVLTWDVLAVIDLSERRAIVEDVALGRIAAALVDGGTFTIGFIVEVESGGFGEKKIPVSVHQVVAVVLVGFHIGKEIVAVQIISEIDQIL